MNKNKILFISQSAIIAGLYVVLTFISFSFGLDKLTPQLRLSEALCILPYFIPSAIPGLFIGCLLSNILFGAVIWDIIFGSLATLIGAFIASKIKIKWLVPLPTVISNSLIVPPILVYAYGIDSAFYLIFGGVFLGELVSCYLLGTVLLLALDKKKDIIFRKR